MPFLFTDDRLDRADHIQLYLSYGLQLILVGQAILSLIQNNWLTLFLSSGTLLLTFMPAIIRRNLKVYLPLEFDLITILFLFASLFLGEIRSYYERVWWWDMALHTVAGLLMGILGFTIVYILNRERRPSLAMSPLFVALFSFTFAMTIGVVWEIFEFGIDSFFGLNMQKSGLVDTMSDLIVNTIGAFVSSTVGYYYVRGGDSLLFDRLVRRFLEGNRYNRQRQR